MSILSKLMVTKLSGLTGDFNELSNFLVNVILDQHFK